MATQDYIIDYKAPTSPAVSDIGRLEAAVKSFDKALQSSRRNLAAFIKAPPPLGQIASDMAKVAGTMKQVDIQSGKVASSFGAAAKAAPNFSATSRSAGAAAQRLQAMTDKAVLATGALANVGQASVNVSGKISVGAGSANSLANAFGLMFIKGMALRAVTKVIGDMGDALKESRKAAEAAAEGSLNRRDKARELANLLGEDEPNDAVMARVFNVGLASGMNFEESTKFLEQFEGSVPAAVKKGHVKEGDKAELAKVGAQMAVRLGLDEGVGGDIAGAIGQHVNLQNQVDKNGKKMSPAEALAANMEAMAYGANEGRGKVSVLMRGEIGQMASAMTAGHIKSPAEMAGFIGTASTMTKTGAFAGTFFKQLDSALNHPEGNAGEFLKEIGAADEDGDLAKIRKLKAHTDAARKASANPARFDINNYLETKGFKSQDERKAVAGMLGNMDVLDKSIAEAEKRSKDPNTAMAKIRAFQQSKDFKNRQSKVRMEAADQLFGEGNENLTIARRNAMARLKRMKLLDAPDQLMADKIMDTLTLTNFLGMPEHVQKRIDEEVFKDAKLAAEKAGVDLHGLPLEARPAFDPETGEPIAPTTGVHGPLPKLLNAIEGVPGALGGDAGIADEMKARDKPKAVRDAWDAAKQPRAGGGGANAVAAPEANVNVEGGAEMLEAARALFDVASFMKQAHGAPAARRGFNPMGGPQRK